MGARQLLQIVVLMAWPTGKVQGDVPSGQRHLMVRGKRRSVSVTSTTLALRAALSCASSEGRLTIGRRLATEQPEDFAGSHFEVDAAHGLDISV